MSRPRTVAGMLPALGVSLLPTVGCPACLPAAASVLGAMGLTFIAEPPYAFWINLGALALALGVLLWNRNKLGFLPFWTAAAGAVAVMAGKFAHPSSVLTWFGIALLLLASIWSASRKVALTSCSACTDTQKPKEE